MARGNFERGEFLDITLYQFSKKLNSTARPNGTAKGVQGQLRESCSMLAPEIGFVAFGQSDSPHAWNYAYIPDFGRFYFIDNWTWTAGMWYASMSVDVLATWRTNIADSTEYVIRSASAYDGTIVDSLYPTNVQVSREVSTANNPFAPNRAWDNGDYCIAISSKGSYGSGFLKYWRLDRQNMQILANKLLGSVDYLNLQAEEISDSLAKALFNPTQYVSSLLYFPCALNYSTDSETTPLPFGWWEMEGVKAYPLLGEYAKKDVYTELQIPKHPQAADLGSWINLEPYSRYTINVPPFGDIPLDSTKIVNVSRLYLHYQIDQYTGFTILRICTDAEHNNVIRTSTAQIGVPLTITQISMSPTTPGSNAVNTGIAVGGAFMKGLFSDVKNWINPDKSMGDVIGTTASNIVSGVGDALQSANAEVETRGAQGCMTWRQNPPQLYATFMPLVETDKERRGRPLCKSVRIGNLYGYVQIYNPDFNAPATSTEIGAVNNFMSDGFFYE